MANTLKIAACRSCILRLGLSIILLPYKSRSYCCCNEMNMKQSTWLDLLLELKNNLCVFEPSFCYMVVVLHYHNASQCGFTLNNYVDLKQSSINTGCICLEYIFISL